MDRKYFHQDKNYLLRDVQTELETYALKKTIRSVLDTFLLMENPMGLQDDFILTLKSKKLHNWSFLKEFYELTSAVYRYLHGDPQLEFLWDGSSHYDYYKKEWVKTYDSWVREMSINKSFSRIIIKACILFTDESHPMLKSHLIRITLQHFGLKLNRKRILIAA